MANGAAPRTTWIPRHSILGQIVHPLFEERRTLAGVMSWIGIGILAVFLVIALFADVIAPFPPLDFVDEKNIPPWTVALVVGNETFTAWSVPANWSTPAAAQTINGLGARSDLAAEVQDFRRFSLRIHTDSIDRVELVVLLSASGTDPGHFVRVNVSADGGRTWSAPVDVRAVGTVARVDVSASAAWSRATLATTAFRVRVTHASDVGAAGNVTLDFLATEVAWRSVWHVMGTDPLGRDVFSRVLHGTRTSLAIMAIGVFFAISVGFPLGLFSGYRGGNLDKLLVLIMDSLYSFPGLLFAGLIAVLLGKGVLNIGLAVTVIYIPLYFRVTRSQVLSAREELYVEAARAIGAPPARIMFRYIALNVLVAIPVIFSISAADAILTAAGLSYLGLGVEAPTADWGLDLSAAADVIDNGIWWSSFFPGLVIVILTIGLSFLGEGLNDIINPVLKKERA
ncbi:MAG: hypothetical protein A3K66_07075 [Euryarchaeota archaeon RBG_16_67_27]|nr:MAG: hypothetical protein A3K66_07075 [Euryarchaeota archaeon RBG_16_67_27]